MSVTRRAINKDATWQRAWTADAVADLASITDARHGDVTFVTENGKWYNWRDDDTWELSFNSVVQTTTVTGTQNDFVLLPSVTQLRCNNATLVSFTGFTPGYNGQVLEVTSIGAGQVDTLNESTGSSAANRFTNPSTSGPTSCAAGKGSLVYIYDATTSRWRLVKHFQADWISVPYLSTDFVCDNDPTGVWTVDSGDLISYKYLLQGKIMTVAIVMVTSTTSGTPSIGLLIKLPLTFTISSVTNNVCINSLGGVFETGIVQVNNTVSATKIRILRIPITNWPVVTNTLNISFTLIFQVD